MLLNRVREYRENRGFSQVEVARRVGIATPNISAVEAGRVMAWPKLRRALAKILKTIQKELFPEDGSGQTRG